MDVKPSPTAKEVERELMELAHIITPNDVSALEAGRITPTILEFQNAMLALRDARGVLNE